jgi:hypothetical protein
VVSGVILDNEATMVTSEIFIFDECSFFLKVLIEVWFVYVSECVYVF